MARYPNCTPGTPSFGKKVTSLEGDHTLTSSALAASRNMTRQIAEYQDFRPARHDEGIMVRNPGDQGSDLAAQATRIGPSFRRRCRLVAV